MATKTFPHTVINVRDDSATTTVMPTTMPLHVPIFPGFAESGPANVPTWGDTALLTKKYGASTFTERSAYYTHVSVYATAALEYQPIYYVRLVPQDAKVATFVLECVVRQKSIVQYQKDIFGGRVLDADGHPIPKKDVDGVTTITEPGISISWRVREFTGVETLKTINPVTTSTNGETITVFPIIASTGSYKGSRVNRVGYKIYYSPDYEKTIVDNTKSMTYRFAPVSLSESTGIASPIRDIYNSSEVDFSLDNDALDKSTDRLYGLSEILLQDYKDLPFQLHVYSEYVKEIGARVLAVSPELVEAGLTEYGINLFTALDGEENPYDHLEITDSVNVLNENVILYHKGGSDGTMTNEVLEALTVEYMSGTLYPAISEYNRYPITHVYDSGYTLATKKALTNIYNMRDDVKIDFCTQDIQNLANTKAEDISTAAALRSSILLHPESTIYGVPACRASVWQQAGYLNRSTSYRKLVPAGLDRLIKRCIYDGKDYTSGMPKGRPESDVTIFSEVNWTPEGDDHRQKSWDLGGNYLEYATTDTLFYADLRSIYPLDTSLLSSDVFVDRLVYLKHIARRIWTIYVGREDDPTRLFDSIAKAIDSAAVYAFNGQVRTKTRVYQTDLDKSLGYQTTVEINLQGNMPNRTWQIIIPVSRMEEAA